MMVAGKDAVLERQKATPQVTILLAPEMETSTDTVTGEAAVPSSWQRPASNEVSDPIAEIPEEPAQPVSAESESVPAEAVSASALPPAIKTWQKYAQPFDASDTRPKIAVVITDLGLADPLAESALALPETITLAFSSMSPDLEEWISKARGKGHEIVLTIPMEPENYPRNDPGPDTLLLALPDADNINRLRRIMARAEGYVGIMPSMGEKFVTSEDKLTPVMAALNEQGVIVLDGTGNRNSLIPPVSRMENIPFARSDVLIDPTLSGQGIDAQFALLEKKAQEQGKAVAVAMPYPVTFQRLKSWAATLEKKGIILAPLSAVINP